MKNSSSKFVLFSSILACVFLFTLESCRKAKSDLNDSPEFFDNSTMTKATFLGQVFKEDGNPLANAEVKTGGNIFQTDVNGFFYFSDISTPKNATLIKVRKDGYFDGFRTVKVISNEDNHVEIILMELPIAKQFESNAGGVIAINGGGSVDFPANAIREMNGNNAYSGTVKVYAKWINPENENINELMPGALRAIDVNNIERGLVTYGMQNVELYGDQGQKLQLIEGKKATLHFPLSANLTASAPNNIPLWYLNESNGMWIEDGTAKKTGSEYVGEVGHFTPWNVDIPFPLVEFECSIIDSNSKPIVGAAVAVISQTRSMFQSFTNSRGKVKGFVPADASCALYYYAPACKLAGSGNFIQNFQTTNRNINLGAMKVEDTIFFRSVIGAVVDCNNNLIANAPVRVRMPGNNNFYGLTNEKGEFDINISCFDHRMLQLVTAFNPVNYNYGYHGITYDPSITTNSGVIAACGNTNNQNDFVSLSINDPSNGEIVSYYIKDDLGSNISQSYDGTNTIINVIDAKQMYNGKPLSFSFSFDGPQGPGTNYLYNYSDCMDTVFSFSPSLIYLDYYNAVGDKIDGFFTAKNLNGQFYNGSTVQVNFRITRQQ